MKNLKTIFTLLVTLFFLNQNTIFAAGWLTNAQGIKVWSNSSKLEELTFTWSGSSIDSYADGNGKLELYRNGKLSTTYTGPITKGIRNGKAVASNSYGDKFEGTYVNGKQTGKGTFTWASGNKYEGNFKDDKFHGKGILTSYSGAKYVGEFKDDKANGKGTFTSASGAQYVGEFKNNKFNGKGTLTFMFGKYKGEWLDGEFHGYGTKYDKDGKILQQGRFENGKFVG